MAGPRINGGTHSNNLSNTPWATIEGCDAKQQGCAKQPNPWEPATAGKQAIVRMFNNRIFNHNTTAGVADVSGCGHGVTVKQLQSTCSGTLLNATVSSELPSDKQIIAWARQLLGMGAGGS